MECPSPLQYLFAVVLSFGLPVGNESNLESYAFLLRWSRPASRVTPSPEPNDSVQNLLFV